MLKAFAGAPIDILELRYFNPIGGLAWWLNRFAKHRSLDDDAVNAQIRIFDKYVLPLSRMVDPSDPRLLRPVADLRGATRDDLGRHPRAQRGDRDRRDDCGRLRGAHRGQSGALRDRRRRRRIDRPDRQDRRGSRREGGSPSPQHRLRPLAEERHRGGAVRHDRDLRCGRDLSGLRHPRAGAASSRRLRHGGWPASGAALPAIDAENADAGAVALPGRVDRRPPDIPTSIPACACSAAPP